MGRGEVGKEGRLPKKTKPGVLILCGNRLGKAIRKEGLQKLFEYCLLGRATLIWLERGWDDGLELKHCHSAIPLFPGRVISEQLTLHSSELSVFFRTLNPNPRFPWK